MYFDTKPCAVCGSTVRLGAPASADPPSDEPVGPREGYVGTADQTVDDRICTNPDCPTNSDSE